MGIKVTRENDEPWSPFIAAVQLWANEADDELVEDGDPSAAFLRYRPGEPISWEDVQRYKITVGHVSAEGADDSTPQPDPEAEPQPDPEAEPQPDPEAEPQPDPEPKGRGRQRG